MAGSGGFTGVAIVLVLIVLLLVRRTVRQLYGTPYSTGRLFVFAGFYVLLFAVLGAGTLYGAVGLWGVRAELLIPLYVAVPIAAAVAVVPHVQRTVRFETRADGRRYYRLLWQLPVLYLALFIIRLVAELIVYGPTLAFATYPPPAPPSVSGLLLLVAVDLLFGVSLGLLIGRGVGVYRAHEALPKSSEPGPSGFPPAEKPLP